MGWFKRFFGGAPPTTLFAGVPPTSTPAHSGEAVPAHKSKSVTESLSDKTEKLGGGQKATPRPGIPGSAERAPSETPTRDRGGIRDKLLADSVTDLAFSADAEFLACTSGYQLD